MAPSATRKIMAKLRALEKPATPSLGGWGHASRSRTSKKEIEMIDAPERHAMPAVVHDGTEDCGKCTTCKRARRDRLMYLLRICAGLLLPFLLASLDLTVVATSLPYIANHFGKSSLPLRVSILYPRKLTSYLDKSDQQTWVVTAYTLTSTAFIPAFGQLSEVFGRHTCLQLVMALMTIGSTLCAAAQSWGMLLLGRALQGVAAAGIVSVTSVVLSDKVSLKDNARNTTIFNVISNTAYAYGPVVGGKLITASWRYCFVISIPIAVVASILIFVLLRDDLVKGTHSARTSFLHGVTTIDWFGTICFISAVCLIILATAWGGTSYRWTSAAVLGPLIVGILLLLLFFTYEYLLEPGRLLNRRLPRQKPMIPWMLFSHTDLILVSTVQFSAGAAIYSVFYYISIYYILVESYPASKAGFQLLYYIPGLGVGVYASMLTTNVYPASTFPALSLGSIIETAGIGLIAYAIHIRHTSLLAGMMAVAGFGTGLRFMPASLHISGVWPTKRAQALSLMRFALPFGGTVGLAIMGAVYNNCMDGVGASPGLTPSLPGGGNASKGDLLSGLSPDEARLVREKAQKAVVWAFVSILPILAVSVVASLGLGNVWIKTKDSAMKQRNEQVGEESEVSTGAKGELSATAVSGLNHAGEGDAEMGGAVEEIRGSKSGSYVLYEPYLLAVIRGKSYLQRKRKAWDMPA